MSSLNSVIKLFLFYYIENKFIKLDLNNLHIHRVDEGVVKKVKSKICND